MVRRWWMILSGRRRAQRRAWAQWQAEKVKRAAHLRTLHELEESF